MGIVTRQKSIQLGGSSTLSEMAKIKYTTDFQGISSTPGNEAQVTNIHAPLAPEDLTYTVTINSSDFSYVAVSATAAQVSAGLVAAINAGTEPVTATDNGSNLDITADVAGTAFTVSVNTVQLEETLKIANGINQVDAYLVGTTNEAAMGTLIDDSETPTCTSSLLAITVNFGSHIVNDITNVTADATYDSTFLVCLFVDDITGDPEVLVFGKTTESEYAPSPSGKTFGAHLKQYGLVAAGTALKKEKNLIGEEQ